MAFEVAKTLQLLMYSKKEEIERKNRWREEGKAKRGK
jgi:hypothetical protein